MNDETSETQEEEMVTTDEPTTAPVDAPRSENTSEEGSASDSSEPLDEDEGNAVEGDAGETETEDDFADEEPEVQLPYPSIVEAIVFSAREPLTAKQIARYCGKGVRQEMVVEAIAELNAHYEATERAFEVVELAETYQLMSRPEYAPYLRRMFGKMMKDREKEKDRERKLSPAALDTLAIIAYKQPILRVEVEAIRGVGCGPIMRQLIERGLVKVVGKKADIAGQPLLYGTTDDFLQEFGLGSLEALPMVHELRRATGTTEELPSAEEESEDPVSPQLTLLDPDEEQPESGEAPMGDTSDSAEQDELEAPEDAEPEDDDSDAEEWDDDEEDEEEEDDWDEEED